MGIWRVMKRGQCLHQHAECVSSRLIVFVPAQNGGWSSGKGEESCSNGKLYCLCMGTRQICASRCDLFFSLFPSIVFAFHLCCLWLLVSEDESNIIPLVAKTDMLGWENTIRLINSSFSLHLNFFSPFNDVINIHRCGGQPPTHTQTHTCVQVAACVLKLYNWCIYLHVNKMWWSLSNVDWETIGFIWEPGASSLSLCISHTLLI